MKKKTKKIIVAICALTIAVSAVCCAVFAANTPATSDDPIITKSYIDSVVLPQIYEYIDGKTQQTNSSVFEVVNVKKGKKLMAGTGCEMILRMGTGSIIASSQGGISDVTSGVDLQNGVEIPLNHLMIVPINDGRGLKITSDAIVMVKGSYSIK